MGLIINRQNQHLDEIFEMFIWPMSKQANLMASVTAGEKDIFYQPFNILSCYYIYWLCHFTHEVSLFSSITFTGIIYFLGGFV